ncbi:MAG: RNA polymerase sigma factor [Spirochaetes bacterium]|nr:RNA polymerase sigma factor [Spirochaetota bacterium]
MISFAGYYLNDEVYEDSDDVVQEVMLNIYSLADFTTPLNDLSAYVYRSLKNRIIDISRRRKTKQNVSLSSDIGNEMTLLDVLHDVRYDTAEENEKEEIRNQFYNALDSLHDKDRAIIIMTEFEGKSFREISEEVNVPVGTLLARKSRALVKIKKYFLKYNPENIFS